MVKNLYDPRADKRDRRDDSTKAKQDNLAQRREEREIEDGRAVIKALERKLQEAKAGRGDRKQEGYVQTSSELQLAEQQLKDEQKKVYRLETELEEQISTTTAIEGSAAAIPSFDDPQATTERIEQDASQARAALKQKEEALNKGEVLPLRDLGALVARSRRSLVRCSLLGPLSLLRRKM
ncbi:hypothetical protein BCR35DRAFT_330901 [Leucosporidium creatinivorum]|uniref:Uncharacterized protein n=1 Tax=Leucosporidium creatinivorum TaxID=106004 RepID=A0A1Y2FKX2_9BASI|nr:hypothetical protein BCR35DRAFT_330901 [Leucosporidium creatinivorum]